MTGPREPLNRQLAGGFELDGGRDRFRGDQIGLTRTGCLPGMPIAYLFEV